MKSIVVVGIVALLQAGFSLVIIRATSGGGSFVGLGAMLFALLGIPMTALVNALLVRANRKSPGSSHSLGIVLVSLLLPAAQSALMVLVSVFRL